MRQSIRERKASLEEIKEKRERLEINETYLLRKIEEEIEELKRLIEVRKHADNGKKTQMGNISFKQA